MSRGPVSRGPRMEMRGTMLRLCILLTLITIPYSSFGGEWSLAFDGLDDWVEISSSPLDSGDPGLGVTCEGWVFVHEADDEDLIFYNGPTIEFNIGLDSNADLAFGVKFLDGGWQTIAAPMNLGEWFHFAAVYNRPGSLLSLYLNGNPVAAEAAIGINPVSHHSVGIGTYAPAPFVHNLWLDGQVDWIRVSEGVLYEGSFTPLVDPSVVKQHHFCKFSQASSLSMLM